LVAKQSIPLIEAIQISRKITSTWQPGIILPTQTDVIETQAKYHAPAMAAIDGSQSVM
jgi:hypothetical protein